MSRRGAADRFGVSISSVIRWDAARRQTGGFAPKPQGGDTRSRRIEAQRAVVMAAFEEDATRASRRSAPAWRSAASPLRPPLFRGSSSAMA
jgi:transposase